MKKTGKYSIGIGDRFGHQGDAQLRAIMEAEQNGIELTPVWNKSNREHIIIGSEPSDVRAEADSATRNAGFTKPYFVDADHINLDTVGRFIESCDFFTIDVASYIGKRAGESEIKRFVKDARKYRGKVKIPGIEKKISSSEEEILEVSEKYLFASQQAGEIYRAIEGLKGKGNFITEISMDEVPQPQTPMELFFILKMLGNELIPLQTFAPKFSGRFNKGVDYSGDPLKFAEEFEADLLIVDLAVREFGLPENLKLSIHSGSDKFSIYPHIGSLIRKHDKGIHIKTAGTTWLEEVIGLSESGGEALEFARDLYTMSLEKMEELCAPYADVIDIKKSSLPTASEVAGWNRSKFTASLRHIPGNHDFNPDMRQLMHVAYKTAALKKDEFFRLIETHENVIAECVFDNLYNRHISRLFNLSN